MGNRGGVGYPSDVSDDEWSFVAPYLTLCREDAKQREYPLRAVFNAVRWLVRSGAHWRMMPNDLPPWPVVYQQTQRWIRAGCFEIMVEDLRSLLREFADRKAPAERDGARQPHPAIHAGIRSAGRIRRSQARPVKYRGLSAELCWVGLAELFSATICNVSGQTFLL